MATPPVQGPKKGDLKGIFKSLQEHEMASMDVSFILDDILTEEEQEKVKSADEDSLRKLCLELLEESKKSKELISTLVHDALATKKKVRELEDKLGKQDAVLSTVLARLDDSKKKLESSVKRSEERVDKMESDKKALETSVKKAEESMNMKFNEVVKLSKGVEEGRSEMSKMSSKVNEVVTNVKGLVKDEMKENAAIIREECDRAKSIIISGIPEPNIESMVKRQDHLRNVVLKVFDEIKDDEDRWMEDVLEIRRVGRYDPNKKALNKRPVKVRFNSERTAMEVIAMAKRLRKVEGMKEIYINKDLSIPERIKLQELRLKARKENESRSDEEAKNYFFAVRRGKVMKLFRRDVIEEELGATGGEEAPSAQQEIVQ